MKLDMTISERDKKLLVILFSFLVIAGAYYFGYSKLVAQTETYNSEIITLRNKKTELSSKVANKEKYIADTTTFNQHFDETLLNYSNGSTQLLSIDFLNKLENLTGTWIKSTSFSSPVSIYTFGSKASSNPSANTAKAYSTDMAGYKTTLTVSYQSEYDQFKNLVKLINEYDKKNTIDNITMSYDNANGYVTGTMTVSMYSITGKDRTYTDPTFDVETGKDNIFEVK